jgi:hypothetical protein
MAVILTIALMAPPHVEVDVSLPPMIRGVKISKFGEEWAWIFC